MSGEVHIYSAASQPATRFRIDLGSAGARWSNYHARHTFYCHRCRKRRWAANLTAQVFYDAINFYCRPGKGCKVGRTR